MADFLPPVVAVLTANITEFSAKMGEAGAEMEGVEGASSKMSALGKTALLGLAAGAVAVGYESVKMASSFQSTMELIATQAHAGQQEVDNMSKSVLALAPTVGIGPEKLAEGLYHVESTGLRGQAALDVLKASAQEAALGMADFDSVTYAMSGVMSIAMTDVKDAADGVAYLNTIVGTGDMRMQDLANAIGTGVLPVFKSAGLGMRDFGSALTVMTDNSMPAEQAANHLKTAVQLLQNQSGPATKALASIGIQSGQLANDLRKPDGFLVAIEDIKTHLEESGKTAAEQGQILSKAFGGARSAATIEEMVLEVDKLKGKYGEMGTVGERAAQQQKDWEATQQTFAQKMKEVGAQFQVWAIQIGQVLLPVLTKLATWFMDSVSWLGNHKDVLIAIGSVAIPLLAMGLWSLVAATWAWTAALLANPVTWIVLAIAAIIFGIIELILHFKQVKEFLAPFGAWVKTEVIDPIIRAWNALMQFLRPVGQWINANVVQPIIRFWQSLVDWARKIWPDISRIIQGFLDFVKAIWQPVWLVLRAEFNAFVTAFKTAWEPIKAFWSDVWDFIKDTFKFAWDIIVAAFKGTWQVISGIVQGIIQVIKGIIDFVVGVFSGDWSRAWNGIKEVFAGIWTFIKGVLGGAWTFITGVFSAAATWLVNAGWDIIRGLWDGIKAAGSWLWGMVSGWASGLISGIKSFFGISSPSKITHEMGGFLVQGLANGILANTHLAVGATTAMVANVLGAAGGLDVEGSVNVSGGGGVSPLTAGLGAGGNQPIQINIQMSPRDVQQFIQQGVLRKNLRNTGNGLAVGVA